MQTDDYNINRINRNQLLVRYSNVIVPIVSMLLKYNWSIFTTILEPINNNENAAFSSLIFPVLNAFEQSSSVAMQSLDSHNSNTRSTLIINPRAV